MKPGVGEAFLRRSTWVFTFLFLSRVALGCQFQSVVATGSYLISSFSIDHAAVGGLSGLYMLPGVGGALLVGLLMRAFGVGVIIICGFLLGISGAFLMSVADRIELVSAGRFISGGGAVVLFVALARMAAAEFSGASLFKAVALIVKGWPVGIGLGALLQPLIASSLGAPAVFVSTSVFLSGCLLLGWSLVDKDVPNGSRHRFWQLSLGLSPHEWYGVALAGLAFALYNVAILMMLSYSTSFLTESGFSHLSAGSLLNIQIAVAIVGVMLGAKVAAHRNGALLVCGAMLVTAAGLSAVSFAPSALLYVVIGLTGGLPAALLMAQPNQALKSENAEVGMGVFFSIFYGSVAGFMPLAGHVKQVFGSTAAVFNLSSGLIVMAVVTLLMFTRRARTEQPQNA